MAKEMRWITCDEAPNGRAAFVTAGIYFLELEDYEDIAVHTQAVYGADGGWRLYVWDDGDSYSAPSGWKLAKDIDGQCYWLDQ